MSSPVLHYTAVTSRPDPSQWICILHGIFGRGRNWAGIATRVAERRPLWGVALIDLRLHGRSPAPPPPHTIAACAQDLLALEQERGVSASVVVGHSFGGKVALEFARIRATPLQQAWLMESTPEPKSPAGSAWEMLQIVRAIPQMFPTREGFVERLVDAGVARPVATWMSSNLRFTEGAYRLALDVDGVEALLRDFFEQDLWPVIEHPRAGTVVHLVKAEGSSTLSEAACRRVLAAGARTGRIFLHRIAGGHWVNADNPDAIVDLLTHHLP